MSQKNQHPAGEPAAEQKPLAGSMLLTLQGGGAEGAAPAPAKPKSKLAAQSQNVITALVITISGGLLFAMRQIGMGAGVAEADEIVIQYTPVNVDPAKRAAQERALAGLQRMAVPMPLEPGSFNLAPFLTKQAEEVPTGEDPEAIAARQEAQRRAEAQRKAEEERQALQDRFGKLVLHSVLEGRTPVARINEEMVQVGMIVDEVFKVESIGNRQVVLDANGTKFTLTQEDPKGDKGGAKKLPKPNR